VLEQTALSAPTEDEEFCSLLALLLFEAEL
jgi:hypothetical protein